MKKKTKIGLLVGTTLLVVAGLVCSEIYVFSVISRGTKPTEQDLSNRTPYSRVCIFGIDGAGGFMDKYDCNEFHEIFDKGAVNYKVMTQHLTDSTPNWFSIFHGVNYLKHHLSNDESKKCQQYFEKYPSFFTTYLSYAGAKKCYSIVHWDTINNDILEDNTNLVKINATGEDSIAIDVDVKNKVIETIDNQDVGIMYMHFDQVDHFGHKFGNKSNEYKAAISRVSSYIDEVYQKYASKGYGNDTLFIAVSDHGMSGNGNHGNPLPSVRNSMVAVYGGQNDIIQGKSGFMVNQDVASIVLYALGLKQPDSYNSKLPNKIFKR